MMHPLQARAMTRRILLAAAFAASFVLLGRASAQADAIAFDVEIFRVDLVRGDDGDIVERFVPVSEAIPGEIIEYRVTAVNEGEIIYRPGTVVVTLPIGDGLVYVEGSATPTSDRVVTEFSADGALTFSEPPVLVTVAEGDDPGAEPEQRAADPSEYDHIRWTFSVPFEPEQRERLAYRVEVR